MNVHNNMRLMCSVARDAVLWHPRREDILRDYKLNSQLHYPERNVQVHFALPNALLSPSSSNKTLYKSKFALFPQTTTHAAKNKEHHIVSPTAGRPAEEETAGQSYSALVALRSNFLLRYHVGGFVPRKQAASVEPEQWKQYFGVSKCYSIASETQVQDDRSVPAEGIFSMSSSKLSNASSQPYNVINGTRNSSFVGNVAMLLARDPAANRKKNSSIAYVQEKTKGENFNARYQDTIKHQPNAFRRSRDLAQRESVLRKSYGMLVRNFSSHFS